LADAAKQIAHAKAIERSVCDVEKLVSIAEHKTLASARQLLCCQRAVKPRDR
jgi:hypothetical protein